MKKVFGLLSVLGLACVMTAGITGCKKEVDKPKTSVVAAAKKQIDIKGDDTATVKQGESVNVTLKLDRGTEATKGDVEFTITVDPKEKVTATADKAVGEAKEAKLVFKADADAKAQAYTVTIKGKATDLTVTDHVVKVTVTEKKPADVKPPEDKKNKLTGKNGKDVSVEQGKKAEGMVTFDAEENVKKEIKLEAKVDGPKGSKGFKAEVGKGAKGENKVAIETTDETTDGDYTVTVTATAEDAAAAATATLKVTVTKKKKAA